MKILRPPRLHGYILALALSRLGPSMITRQTVSLRGSDQCFCTLKWSKIGHRSNASDPGPSNWPSLDPTWLWVFFFFFFSSLNGMENTSYDSCRPYWWTLQSSHVPKFGNWERENVPYTTYFENARRDRGAKIINPNDPEQNPDAFITVGRTSSTRESETRQKLQHTEISCVVVGAPPKLPIGSKSEYMLEQQQQHRKKHLDMGRAGASFNDDLEASTHHAYSHHQRIVVDNDSQGSRRNHHKSRSSSSAHSGSDKTSSDYSLLKSHHHLHVHEGGDSSSGLAIFMKSGNARRDEVVSKFISARPFLLSICLGLDDGFHYSRWNSQKPESLNPQHFST